MSKLIDNYIIISTIGSSDWCEEHKGRNLLTKELVFIRTVRVDRFYSDTILKERILNEINVLKRIHSESVVKMHLYLIYEYVSEGIDKYPYGCLQFLRCFLQVWRDIARCGVTHGSLRPSAIRF
jgi:serine/threonine protein kinase